VSQVPPVSHLECFGRAASGSTGIDAISVTADDLGPRMVAEPLHERISRGIFEQVNNLVSTHVHQNRPVTASAAKRKFVAELQRVIDLDPRSVGVPSAVWTTRLLSTYLEQVTGLHTGIETVRVHLHRAGYVCKRPTWSLKRKSTEQAGWVKNA
jgi:transposase